MFPECQKRVANSFCSMVKAIIDISEEANDILNLVKATNKLRTKSEAIEAAAEHWMEAFLDRPLKPEFIKKKGEVTVNPAASSPTV